LDSQITVWGKWRPSAKARRLGPWAVTLERMVVRDQHPLEAALVLAGRPGGADELVAAAADVCRNRRWSRRTFVPLDDEEMQLSHQQDPLWRLVERDRDRHQRRLRHHLHAALGRLAVADRELLVLRHGHGLRVSEIARRLGAEQVHLYRRFTRIHRRLRTLLGELGVSQHDAVEALAGTNAIPVSQA